MVSRDPHRANLGRELRVRADARCALDHRRGSSPRASSRRTVTRQRSGRHQSRDSRPEHENATVFVGDHVADRDPSRTRRSSARARHRGTGRRSAAEHLGRGTRGREQHHDPEAHSDGSRSTGSVQHQRCNDRAHGVTGTLNGVHEVKPLVWWCRWEFIAQREVPGDHDHRLTDTAATQRTPMSTSVGVTAIRARGGAVAMRNTIDCIRTIPFHCLRPYTIDVTALAAATPRGGCPPDHRVSSFLQQCGEHELGDGQERERRGTRQVDRPRSEQGPAVPTTGRCSLFPAAVRREPSSDCPTVIASRAARSRSPALKPRRDEVRAKSSPQRRRRRRAQATRPTR